MTPLRFHHVGLACRKLESEHLAHLQLGFVPENEPFIDPLQKIRGQFLVHGTMRIELLEPTSADSPLMAYLSRGQKMYHQAFETDDLPASIDALVAGGALKVSPPTPAVAFGGRPIAFLMLRTMLLVELIQTGQVRAP